MKKIKAEVDPKDFERNPLVDHDFKIKIRRFKDGSWTTDKENITTYKETNFEQERFTKVFAHDPDKRKSVSMLTGNASKLLLWITNTLQPGKDYVFINYRLYMQENHIFSVNTYKAAVDELCRYLFIYAHANKKYKDYYWINPRIIFNGNRLIKYPNNLDKDVNAEPIKPR